MTTQESGKDEEGHEAAGWCFVGLIVLVWLAAGVHVVVALVGFPESISPERFTVGVLGGNVLLMLSAVVFFGGVVQGFQIIGIRSLAAVSGVWGLLWVGLIGWMTLVGATGEMLTQILTS